MAFNAAYLTPMTQIGFGKVNLWTYKTDDSAATVDTADYFPTGYGIKVGDWVLRTTVTNLGASNEAVATAGIHLVSTASSTSVDVNDVLALTLTDTD